MDLFPNEQNFDLDKSRQKFHHNLKEHCKMVSISEKRYQFPMHNTKWLKNCKLRRAILSTFYNILQRNFGILLILWCSFALWWNFCLDLSRSKFCSLGNRSIVKEITCSGHFNSIWLKTQFFLACSPSGNMAKNTVSTKNTSLFVQWITNFT
jgi:hypothetical protein